MPESLEKKLEYTSGTERVKVLNALALEFAESNPSVAEDYAIAALTLSEQINYLEGRAGAHNNLGISYVIRGEFSHAMDNFIKSLEIWEKIGNKDEIASLYGNIGGILLHIGEPERALDYALKALNITEETKNKRGLAYSYSRLGVIYLDLKDYTNKHKDFWESL